MTDKQKAAFVAWQLGVTIQYRHKIKSTDWTTLADYSKYSKLATNKPLKTLYQRWRENGYELRIKPPTEG